MYLVKLLLRFARLQFCRCIPIPCLALGETFRLVVVPLPVASKLWKLGLQVHVPFRKHRPLALHTVHWLVVPTAVAQAAPRHRGTGQLVSRFVSVFLRWLGRRKIFTSGFFSSFSPLLQSSLASRNINKKNTTTYRSYIYQRKIGNFQGCILSFGEYPLPFLSDNAP